MGISSLEWEPRGRGSELGEQLLFANLEGYVGAFDNVYPPETESTNQITDETTGSSSPVTNDDPFVNSWLMYGLCVGYFDVIDCYCIFGLMYCAWYFWNWLCNISFVPI